MRLGKQQTLYQQAGKRLISIDRVNRRFLCAKLPPAFKNGADMEIASPMRLAFSPPGPTQVSGKPGGVLSAARVSTGGKSSTDRPNPPSANRATPSFSSLLHLQQSFAGPLGLGGKGAQAFASAVQHPSPPREQWFNGPLTHPESGVSSGASAGSGNARGLLRRRGAGSPPNIRCNPASLGPRRKIPNGWRSPSARVRGDCIRQKIKPVAVTLEREASGGTGWGNRYLSHFSAKFV